MRTSTRFSLGFVVLFVLSAGCLTPRDGQFACPPPERACPAGLSCGADGLCRRSTDMDGGLDAAMDASVLDAPRPDASTDTGAGIDAGRPPCDPMETPASLAVFVREEGTGDGSSPSSPLGSLTAAIALARTGRPTIYLAEGTYTEALDVTSPPAGLSIDGGWIASGGVWRRDCESGRDATLIAPPSATAMQIHDATLGFELAHLTIETSPPGTAAADSAGDSRVALLVTGTGSAVSLVDVVLRARDAQAGGAASPSAPAEPTSCDRVTCGDGGAGGSGSAGLDGTPAEDFAAARYTPVDGGPGMSGERGRDGSAGGGGFTAATNCCDGCNGGGGCSTVCNAGASVPTGRCGCGGRPGGAGRPGRGGGASVGLLISGTDATVAATYSVIESGAGGAGSAGGAPASPSTPSVGVSGSAECCTSCRVASPCPACSCFREACTTYTTTPGTMGGAAGSSGAGGSGAGGPSFAVVATSGGRFVGAADATNDLRHGPGGTGPTGNDGRSGTLLAP